MNDIICPVPPISDAEYAAALGDSSSLDAICIVMGLAKTVARGLADQAGEEWFDEPVVDDDGNPVEDQYLDAGVRAVEALVQAELLNLANYVYDDAERRTRMADA